MGEDPAMANDAAAGEVEEVDVIVMPSTHRGP
jgi:hypothetical protein